MAFFSAYFDESGHPDDSAYMIVAGFVSEIDQWIRFESEWESVKKRHGAPEVFHANRFFSRDGLYGNWSEAKMQEFLRDLIGVIGRRTSRSFSVTLEISSFKKYDKDLIMSETVGSPFPYCARICLAKISKWAAQFADGAPVETVFEDGPKHKGQLLYLAERDCKPTPIFKKKEEAKPCQAADLLAWSHNRTMNDRVLPDGIADCLDRLASFPNDWVLVTEKQIVDIANLAGVTKRDPNFRYISRIETIGGKRVSRISAYPRHYVRGPIETIEVKEGDPNTPFESIL